MFTNRCNQHNTGTARLKKTTRLLLAPNEHDIVLLTIESPQGFGVNSGQQLTVGGEATREVSYESQVATTVGHCERCVGKVGPGHKTKPKMYEAMFRCYGLPHWCQVCKSELRFASDSLTHLVSEVHNGVEGQQATPPNRPACNP